MRTIIVAFLLFLSLAAELSATPQRPNILLYEGKELPLLSNPLEAYFSKFPERDPKGEKEQPSSLWRGYIATFEINDGQLFLKEIAYGFSDRSALALVSPNGERMKIDWFTGLLLTAYGDNRGDAYSLDFDHSYETYSIFEINAGSLVKAKKFSNKQYLDFTARQFEAFKTTPEYKAKIDSLSVNGRKLEESTEIIRQWIIDCSPRFLVD